MGPACQALLGHCNLQKFARSQPLRRPQRETRQLPDHRSEPRAGPAAQHTNPPLASLTCGPRQTTVPNRPSLLILSLRSSRFRFVILNSELTRDSNPLSAPPDAERGRRVRDAKAKTLLPSLPRTPMDPPRAVAVLLLILLPVLAPVASGVPFVVLHGWGFACLASILLLLLVLD